MTHSLRKTLLILSICFIAMLTWLTTFTIMAFSVDEPMMDKAYYRKGMDYQKRLDALRRGARGGWYIASNIKNGRMQTGANRLEVRLGNRNSGIGAQERASARGAVLYAALERPASTRDARRYRLTRSRLNADGTRTFQVDVNVPGPGYWELVLEAGLGDDVRVYHRTRIYAGR